MNKNKIFDFFDILDKNNDKKFYQFIGCFIIVSSIVILGLLAFVVWRWFM